MIAIAKTPKTLKRPKSETAEELVAKANELHTQIINLQRRAITLAKEAGDALRQAKKKVQRGQWKPWGKEHFHDSYELAVTYMRISRKWYRIEPLVIDNPKLSLEAALQILRVQREPKSEQATSQADQARTILRETFFMALKDWSDEEVLYLARPSSNGVNHFDDFLGHLHDALQPVCLQD